MSNLKNNRLGRLKKKLAPRIVAAFKAIGEDVECESDQIYFRKYQGDAGGFVAHIFQKKTRKNRYYRRPIISIESYFTMKQAINRGFILGPNTLPDHGHGDRWREVVLKPAKAP